MAIRPDYDVGTVTLVASSANFTTSGSSLQTAAVQAGDAIIAPSGHVLIIASITGQNSGTLFLPCPAAAAGTGLPLRIRFQPDGSRYQGAVRNLIELLASGNLEAFAALVGANGMVPIFTGPGTLDLADPATFGIQDPNGSLGKLAALTLAANKVINTDGSGNPTQSDITAAAIALLNLEGAAVADSMPFFYSDTAAALTPLTAAARALLNLEGAAVADSMPFFYSDTAAALTPLTAYARTILDDTTGAAMFATMGATQSFGGLLSSGYQKLPSGLIIQWGSSVVTTASEVVWVNYPTTYPTAVFTTVVCNGDTGTPSAPNIFGIHDGTGMSGFVLRTTGFSGTVRANWLSVGR